MNDQIPNHENGAKELSLAEQAYAQLKERILKNDYPSGEFISINDLCESVDGLGRTPVREAVQRLHEERLLSVVPRKGIIVPQFDFKNMMEQFELRYVLEKYITIKAAGKLSQTNIASLNNLITELRNFEGKSAYTLARMNMFFHMVFAEVANNEVLSNTLTRLYDHQIRVYTYYYENTKRHWSTQEEHDTILQATISGDVDAISKAVEIHYKNTRKELLNSLLD